MFTFNGKHASEFDILVHSVGRDILPPLQARLVEIPNGVGSYDFGTYLEKRTISVNISIQSEGINKVAAKLRSVAQWLYTEGLVDLSFDDEPEKTYKARLDGNSDVEEVVQLGRGTLTFLCPNPLAFGETKNQTETTFTNSGTFRTYIKVEAAVGGYTNYLKVTLVETGEFVNFVGGFNENDEIVIDFEKQYATLNGVSMMDRLDLQSDFFSIPQGTSNISLNAQSTITASYSYQEKFL